MSSNPFDVYYYDDALHAWRSATTGRSVATSVVRAEVDLHIKAGQDMIAELTREQIAGDISLVEWKVSVAAELKDMHGAFAMYGAGGRDVMTPAMWGRVGGNLGDEYKHLQDLTDAVARGDVSGPQMTARIKQYGQASKQAYWGTLKESAPQADRGLPLLTASPGDGSTRCHGNCNCEIVIHKDGSADWVTHPGEHCPDCLANAARGPYRLN